MAEVKLQVVVKREQVNQLQADIDKLNKTKITINTKETERNLKQANKLLQDVEKTQQAALKTEEQRAKVAERQSKADAAAMKVEKERASALAEKARAMKDVAKAETEHARQAKEAQRTEERAVRTERQRIKLAQDQAKATKEATKETEEHSKAVKKQGALYDILGRSVTSFIARMAAYRAVYGTIRAITQGFTEALETLKAVDDELVTVRKVTGFDAAQMANVESQAYSVASKYGSSAADYTAGVAAFARAGYKELAGDLAELSQKTQIVGDTTAEVANQFLLSVDAAYKYNGSVTELTRVLDMANELDNKYATSIEKIAEGMGIVAPVAAQMHVGVDELAAAIGTVTAVTQRSGTEAARALRALFLNIVGDTKTEIEEGVTWTTGEIEGLKDVIKKYAPEAYKAAAATGAVIDPMKAIGGLAQSMKEGLLTEQELMEMVSDIGGKLRTSQLLALIQNWDMYNSMLEDTANAAGSADKEIENAMDSWTRKTNVLKNTWTEFIKTGLDSSFFKGAIDTLTSIVQRLGTLEGTLTRLIPIFAALKLRDLAKNFSDIVAQGGRLSKVFDAIGISAKGLNIAAGAVGALGAAWTIVSYIIEDAKRKHEEEVRAQYEAADAATESSKNILDLSMQMENAAMGSDELRESGEKLADTLGTSIPEGAEAAIQKLRSLSLEQLRAAAGTANKAYYTSGEEMLSAAPPSNYDKVYYGITYDLPERLQWKINSVMNGLRSTMLDETGNIDVSTVENMEKYREAMEKVNDAFNEYVLDGGSAEVFNSKYYKELQEYLNETADTYEEFKKRKKDALDNKAAYDFAKAVQSMSVNSEKDLNRLIGSFVSSEKYTSEEKDALIALAYEYYPQYKKSKDDAASATDNFADSVGNENEELKENQKALEANATAEDRAAEAKKNAANAARMLIPYLFDEKNELTGVGAAALASDKYLAGLVQSELESQYAAARANYSSLVAQLAAVGITAETTAAQLWAMARAAAGNNPFSGAIAGAIGGAYSSYQGLLKSKLAEIQSLMGQISGVSAYSGTAPSWSSSSGSSGKSSGGSSGKSGSSSGGKSSSSKTEDKKLTAYQNKVALLKSELSLMQERGDSEDKQIAKMKEIMKALNNEAKYLKSIKGDQITINNLTQEYYSYKNKIAEAQEKETKAIQAAVDAQKALNDALNDRSVRYYNAATGQWEWGANAENVHNAQSALENAIADAGFTSMKAWNSYYKTVAGTSSTGGTGYGSGSASPIWDISALTGNSTVNNVGGNTYNSNYNFGGISLTEQQINSMSMRQLVQMVRQLALHNSTY
jgi:TP901 family phage tail tape measure protein